ncbi:phage antirepressor KilAC domain-containing protein [Sphingobacterium psychroaquaticum]|uniref:Phage antirepressor protein YoqD, KilAC domain n=1 Tax=Sphingobacterium psychroaquaticum TaxID=561061 RepID=A0A1X7JTL8_9SPHI|nr:phage antirepressor KilAC domain-containing protein [Sphingobacterium psychroaquaticum]SMG31736.1 Phage antirepressor protein YoqD, KilAC domain [Sphingobacterium psychroaquaticum]
MNNIVQLFSYQGNEVTFRNEQGIAYVNANNMAKPFKGKEPKHWFENKETHEFLHALAFARGYKPMGKIPTSLNTSELARVYPSLLIVVKGGLQQQGTWMHEDVALEYAQWLSVDFKLWCNDRIKELLKVGMTTTHSISELVDNPDMIIEMATKLKAMRAENEAKQLEIDRANQTILTQAPKVRYVDEVLLTDNLITATTIAKELGFSAVTLNNKLKDLKIQYKQNGHFVLYSQYQDKGFTKTKTHTFLDSSGVQQVSIQTYWTQKGRAFIHGKLNPEFQKHDN